MRGRGRLNESYGELWSRREKEGKRTKKMFWG